MTTKRALIVVDVQNDFVTGSLPVDKDEIVAAEIGKYMAVHGRDYDAVVTTQDWHIEPGDHWSETPDFIDSWPVHGKAGDWGAELHWAVKGVAVTRRFFKGQREAAYSGFQAGDSNYGQADQGLGEFLLEAGITDVDVVGLATDYCVKATALDAIKYGFTTRVLTNLVAAVTPEGGVAALKEMAAAGIEEVAA